MLDQRKDEWKDIDQGRMKYHTGQWDLPKRSTVAFEGFAAHCLRTSDRVVDIGCGTGASTAYVADKHPDVEFIGIDYSRELIALGKRMIAAKGISNLRLEEGDCFALKRMPKVDGVISLQTLSWLPEFEAPILEIFSKMAPKWIAASSLFYSGDISCRAEVEEHRKGKKYFYNTYALPALRRFVESHGYAVTLDEPFNIDIDLAEPDDPDMMGTYTRAIAGDGQDILRLQISGPLLMNWHQVLIERK